MIDRRPIAATDAADFAGTPVIAASELRTGAEARTFLNAVFGTKPDSLFILLWCPHDKSSAWFQRIDEAVAFIDRHSNQDVYVGVALSPTNFGRNCRCKAEETAGIGALWIDLDVQSEAHKKQNLPPTIDDALGLIPSDLPPSIVIHSGHGLQAWWLLDGVWQFTDSADRLRAAELAENFKKLFKRRAAERGWDVDAVDDLARLMRVPGTTNTKVAGHHRPVGIMQFNERRYALGALEEYLRPTDAVRALTAPRPTPKQELGEPVGFILNAGANPPLEKFDLLCEVEPRFRDSWEHNRPDLQDSSPSAFDLSLANYTAMAGWSDQEIVNLLIANRRKHKADLKLRADYYRLTISKARAVALAFHEELEAGRKLQALTEAVAASGVAPSNGRHPPEDETSPEREDPDARREEILRVLSVTMKLSITKFVKYTGDEPQYRLETADGPISLGGVNGVLSQGTMRARIAAATNKLLPRFKDQKWDDMIALLLEACEEVDRGEDATLRGMMMESLRSYLDQRPPHDSLADADEGREPFLEDGSVYIFTKSFRTWLAQQENEKITQNELTARLRSFGSEPKKVSLIAGGRATTRSAWRIPSEVWERIGRHEC